MANLKDFIAKDIETQTRFFMFTGEPGTRKSTTALSFPTPQYWFQFDQKISSILIPMKKWGVNPEDIDYDDYPDFNKALKKLEAFQQSVKNSRGEKYKTIIIDSITSLADATNLQTLRLKAGTTNKDGGEKGMRIAGIAVNSLEDYKAENSAFQQTISILKDIQQFHKVNIILIAHVQGEHDKDKKSSRLIITGGKAISGKLPAYCEEVYYFYSQPNADPRKEPDRFISTVHTGQDFARTTLILPSQIKLSDKPFYSEVIKPALESFKV